MKLREFLKSKDEKLYYDFVKIEDKAKQGILDYQTKYGDTINGLNHIQDVEENLDCLLNDMLKEKFAPFEIYILLSAVYLHDIGKITKNYKNHVESSEEIINNYYEKLGIDNKHIAKVIAWVAYGHGKNDIEKLRSEWAVNIYGIVKVQFLAALLRLADELSMSYDRAPDFLKHALSDIKAISLKEEGKWSLRESISSININPTEWKITIYAISTSKDTTEALNKARDYVQERLKEILGVLRSNNILYELIDLEVEEVISSQNIYNNSITTSAPTSTPTPESTKYSREHLITAGNNDNMVFIKGGSYQMGAIRNKTTVTVGDFYIGKYEVTNKEYCHYDPFHPNPGDDLPVVNVSWNDAVAYCKWLSNKDGKNYRLPTKAEWEYACRSGSNTKYFYYWGDNMDDNYCWYNANSGGKVHPVGQKNSNAWGLYDMLGNVWEWCNDKAEMIDNSESRSIGGGAWNLDASSCCSWVNGCTPPDDYGDNIGFRVVRVTQPVITGITEMKGTFTKEQLNKISIGTSLFEVEQITGWPGKIIKESNMGHGDDVDFKNFKRIFWKNSDGTGIAITFHDNKVFDKNWWPTGT